MIGSDFLPFFFFSVRLVVRKTCLQDWPVAGSGNLDFGRALSRLSDKSAHDAQTVSADDAV